MGLSSHEENVERCASKQRHIFGFRTFLNECGISPNSHLHSPYLLSAELFSVFSGMKKHQINATTHPIPKKRPPKILTRIMPTLLGWFFVIAMIVGKNASGKIAKSTKRMMIKWKILNEPNCFSNMFLIDNIEPVIENTM